MRELTGAWAIARLTMRRDRVRLALWIAGIAVLVAVTVVSTKGLYPTQLALDQVAAVTVDNPAASALNGPPIGLDTVGGQVAYQVGAAGLTAVGLMSLLLMSRVTRGEEESGRLELVRACPVGRHAPLVAGLVAVAMVDVAVGTATAAVLLYEGLPASGSLALGASFAVLGFVFAALAGVTAQVTENPRVASGIAGAWLAAAYVIRAAGDATGGALSWASPIGLAQKVRPYADEQWWPLAVCILLASALVAIAFTLSERRDFGTGLVPPRAGRAHAAPSLRGPVGLAVRLQRGVVGWWALGILLMAAASGLLVSSIDDFVMDNQAVEDVIVKSGGASLGDSFLSTVLLLLALGAAGAALQVTLRLRSEETSGRGDVILATEVPRWRWFGSHVVLALAGSALVLAAGGLGLGATAALVQADPHTLPDAILAALAYLPAVWTLIGASLALVGLAPRWATLAWGMWAVWLVLAMFGALLDPPPWVLALSPFEHTPFVPAEAASAPPLLGILAVAALLTCAGFLGARRRDIG